MLVEVANGSGKWWWWVAVESIVVVVTTCSGSGSNIIAQWRGWKDGGSGSCSGHRGGGYEDGARAGGGVWEHGWLPW